MWHESNFNKKCLKITLFGKFQKTVANLTKMGNYNWSKSNFDKIIILNHTLFKISIKLQLF